MKKLGHILIGWAKIMGLVPISTAEQKLSDLRLSICLLCEFSEVSGILELTNGSANHTDVLKCTICKCPCKQKSVVIDEKCPKSLW